MINYLYVLYDGRCGICAQARRWIQKQAKFVAYDFIPAGSPRTQRLFPELKHDQDPKELVVVTDEGAVYQDNEAWILCLWGLREYRVWSYRFAQEPLRSLARAAWVLLSSNRMRLS